MTSLFSPATEIDPTYAWGDDSLKRADFIRNVEKLISRLPRNGVIAIEAPWGAGKTWMLERWEAEVKCRDYKDEAENEYGAPFLFFNAWKADLSTDPVASLVADLNLAIQKTIPTSQTLELLKRASRHVVKKGLPVLTKLLTAGMLDYEKDVESVLAGYGAGIVEDFQNSGNESKSIIEKFKIELGKAAAEIKAAINLPLTIVVDELDRCRPNFAVEILEAIKHLFDVPNVFFVLSIDKTALAAAISGVYGESYNGEAYLDRFIDVELSLPNSIADYLRNAAPTSEEITAVFGPLNDRIVGQFDAAAWSLENWICLLGLKPRNINRIFDRFRVAQYCMDLHAPYDPYVFSFLVALRYSQSDLFKSFVEKQSTIAETMDRFTLLSREKFLLNRFAIETLAILYAARPVEHPDDYFNPLKLSNCEGSLNQFNKTFGKFENSSHAVSPYLPRDMDLIQFVGEKVEFGAAIKCHS